MSFLRKVKMKYINISTFIQAEIWVCIENNIPYYSQGTIFITSQKDVGYMNEEKHLIFGTQ